MTTVGFIGLGRMGRGMARNIHQSGLDLMVYDVSEQASQPFRQSGARVASSIGEVARSCEVVFTPLPGPPEVEDVMRGPGGLIEHATDGLVVFDLSTSSLALARQFQQEFAARGATFFDAPVSGGPAGAASGELVLWVGGPRDVFDSCQPILDTFSYAPRLVGDVGAGIVTKLAHNALGYMFLASLAESFSMAVNAGLDPLDLWEALKLGMVGRQSMLDGLVSQFLPGEYDKPAFAMRLAHKDMTLVTGLARDLGVPMRIANLTYAEMTEALAKGLGDEDSRSFMKLQLERAGVHIAVDRDRLDVAVARASGQQGRTTGPA